MRIGLFLGFVLCWNYARTSTGDDIYDFYRNSIAPAASQLDRDLPNGAMTSLLKYPELVFEPRLDGYYGLIRFNTARPSSYMKYVDRLDQVLGAYDLSKQATDLGDTLDCAAFRWYRHPDEWDYKCRVDLISLGAECSKHSNYGYEDGMPCVVLSLDRIYNWVPEPYTNETVPDAIRSSWVPESVAVKCEGSDPMSADNMNDALMYPESGFRVTYFPYNGQTNWLSPLVGVIVIPTPAVAVEVKCTVWAKNIIHRDLINTGSVKFTVLVE